MFDSYTSADELPTAMFAGYKAKKMAEVAPGVGEATDVFAIMTDVGAVHLLDDLVEQLDLMYKRMRVLEKEAQKNMKNSWRAYFEKRRDELEGQQTSE